VSEQTPLLCIAGTDTGIGKTWISRLLCDCAARTREARYVKAVQTGCTSDPIEGPRAPDLDWVSAGRATMSHPYELHAPYRFLPACSPHLAARLANQTIDTAHILRCIETVRAGAGLTVVEGAGGLLVPLNDRDMIIDLFARLDAPVALVATPRLGTLNHTFLALEALERRGIATAGVVINNCDNTGHDFISQDNIAMIARRCAPAPCAVVDYQSRPDAGPLESFFDELAQRL
jgi:dethiobiotin synthase